MAAAFEGRGDLPALDLNAFGSLLVSMHIDQRFLASRAEQIAGFLHDGGTVIANGHLAYPFLPGITGFHPLENYGLGDLAVLRLIDHPIWAGVSENELTFRRGAPVFTGAPGTSRRRARPTRIATHCWCLPARHRGSTGCKWPGLPWRTALAWKSRSEASACGR